MMRQKYAQELSQWKAQSVTYNNYQRYGILFDRTIPWSEKIKLL